MTDREGLKANSQLIQAHGRSRPAETLAEIAAWCQEQDIRFDEYGRGELIESFEAAVAETLGFSAARFMPSGTMAQQIALRIWSERAGHDHVGMHPTSHVELHEERGYTHLHGLQTSLVGPADRPLLAEHLAERPENLAALLIELPIREAGGQLPTWNELAGLKKASSERGIPLHLDGARIWECAPFYGRSYQEICEGFDSCYVSFYKGVGALPGAMLLGPTDFIAEAAVWQRRSGGNLYTLTPNVASAAMLWRGRIARMPDYYERAQQIATLLGGIDGMAVLPDPPHVNMMHVFLARAPEDAAAARDHVAEEHGLWLFGNANPGEMPGYSRFELYVGEALMKLGDDQIERAFHALMQAAT